MYSNIFRLVLQEATNFSVASFVLLFPNRLLEHAIHLFRPQTTTLLASIFWSVSSVAALNVFGLVLFILVPERNKA